MKKYACLFASITGKIAHVRRNFITTVGLLSLGLVMGGLGAASSFAQSTLADLNPDESFVLQMPFQVPVQMLSKISFSLPTARLNAALERGFDLA